MKDQQKQCLKCEVTTMGWIYFCPLHSAAAELLHAVKVLLSTAEDDMTERQQERFEQDCHFNALIKKAEKVLDTTVQ